MSIIRVHVDHLSQAGQRLLAEAEHFYEVRSQLDHAILDLDIAAWSGRSRERTEPLLSQVSLQVSPLIEQMERLGRQLYRVAETFEQVDATLAAGLERIPWRNLDGMSQWHSHPLLRVGALLGGGAAAVGLTTLPLTGDESELSLVDRVGEWAQSVGAWFRPAIDKVATWLGWKKEPEAAWHELEPYRILEPGKIPDGEPVRFESLPKPMPVMSDEIHVETLDPRDLTPVLAQTPRSYECAPTAASMVLGYWHNMDPQHQTCTPQELIRDFGSLYDPNSGMNAEQLVEGIKSMDLGYKTVDYQSSLDQASLRSELGAGPVLAVVRTNWAASGTNNGHMVTVTEMSEDGQTVYVNDPWTGKSEEISWSTFMASWSWPEGFTTHTIVRIRP